MELKCHLCSNNGVFIPKKSREMFSFWSFDDKVHEILDFANTMYTCNKCSYFISKCNLCNKRIENVRNHIYNVIMHVGDFHWDSSFRGCKISKTGITNNPQFALLAGNIDFSVIKEGDPITYVKERLTDCIICGCTYESIPNMERVIAHVTDCSRFALQSSPSISTSLRS